MNPDIEIVNCSICGVPDDKALMIVKEMTRKAEPGSEGSIITMYLCQQCAAHIEVSEKG